MNKLISEGKNISVIILESDLEVKNRLEQLDTEHLMKEIICLEKDEKVNPALLNKLLKKATGDYIYFYFPEVEFPYEGVKKAAELLSQNEKIQIAGMQELSDSTKKRELDDFENGSKIYYSELQLKVQFGWFNFVVKNTGITFDETLPLKRSYIQYYLKYIGEKGYFGFVWDACMNENTECPYNKYKLDDYEDYISMLDFLSSLLDGEDAAKKSLAYRQSVVMKVLDEILVNEGLIPETLKEEEQKVLKEKISLIMDRIDTEVVLRCKSIENYHLCYFLSFKTYGVETLADKGKFGVFDQEEEILVWDTIGFRIDSIRETGKSICLKGNFQNPACYLMPFDVYLVKNGKKIKIKTEDSLFSYRGSKQKIANCRDFTLELPLTEKANYRFSAEILGTNFDVKLFYNNQMTLNRAKTYRKIIRRTMCYFGADEIKIEPLSIFAKFKYNKRTNDEMKQVYPKQYAIREKYAAIAKSSKKVMLYIDPNGNEDFYAFYQKEAQKKDGYKRYYASNQVKEENPNEIKFGNKKCKELFMGADVVVTSSPEFINYSPLNDTEYKYAYDLMSAKMIYAHAKENENSKEVLFLRGLINMDEEIVY